MKNELENEAQFILLNFFDGISEEEYQQLVNVSGFLLNDEVKDFYLQTNGLQFIYIKKSNNRFNLKDIPDHKKYFDWMWTWKDYWQIDGIINILPLQVSLRGNWNHIIYFDYQKEILINNNGLNETIYNYRKRIRPFDFYSKDSIVSFYQVSKEKIEIVMGIENNTEFVRVKKEGFSSYLQFLLDIKASPNKRKKYI
jgi:hypothetical protein